MQYKTLKILIVKTSSLGDIVQAFSALDYLKNRGQDVIVDWVVESSLQMIVAAHPLVRRAIAVETKELKKSFSAWIRFFQVLFEIRKEAYDVVFDLQGNCKSGLITAFCKSPKKVGFGWHSVRERPNLLATNDRFDTPKNLNMCLQYVQLIQKFFQDPVCSIPSMNGVRFNLESSEQVKLQEILQIAEGQVKTNFGSKTLVLLPDPIVGSRIMVCPGSRWINKQLPIHVWIELLERIQKKLNASFFLIWGDEAEKILCQQIQVHFFTACVVIEKLALPTWQNLMNEMRLVIAVDSSALHLCGTTPTPSFSLFGPTSPEVFKPIGDRHFSVRGICPYGRSFEKTCPILRTCPTGACIRRLSVDQIFGRFAIWWDELQDSESGLRETALKN